MKKTVNAKGTYEIKGAVAGAWLGGMAACIACPPLAPVAIILGALFGRTASKIEATSEAKRSPESVEADKLANSWKDNHRYAGENGITTSFGDSFCRNEYKYELDEDEKKSLSFIPKLEPLVPKRFDLDFANLNFPKPEPFDIDAIMKSLQKGQKP